jgi:hypothetical protein
MCAECYSLSTLAQYSQLAQLERLDEDGATAGIQRLLHRSVRDDVAGDEHDVGTNAGLIH